MKIRLTSIILAFQLLVYITTTGQENNGFKKDSSILYEGSYALVIGVHNYNNGWSKLPGVKIDIDLVSEALEKNGFFVYKVIDPNKDEFEEAFENFIKLHGYNFKNRLLIYYAGHGHTVTPKYGGTPLGYIIPKEAPNPYKDEAEFKRIAMSMQRIEEYAINTDAKHVMFLFDACFSGSLFSISRSIPENISYKSTKPVRQFITSGSDEETVPDKSIFRQQFIEAIKGEADVNKDGFVTGTELGDFLQDRVINYSKGSQHPQYGKIRNPNLDKGDFIFKVPGLNRSSGVTNTSTTEEIREVEKLVASGNQLMKHWILKSCANRSLFNDSTESEFSLASKQPTSTDKELTYSQNNKHNKNPINHHLTLDSTPKVIKNHKENILKLKKEEEELWQKALQNDNYIDYRKFLISFPNGKHTQKARIAIEKNLLEIKLLLESERIELEKTDNEKELSFKEYKKRRERELEDFKKNEQLKNKDSKNDNLTKLKLISISRCLKQISDYQNFSKESIPGNIKHFNILIFKLENELNDFIFISSLSNMIAEACLKKGYSEKTVVSESDIFNKKVEIQDNSTTLNRYKNFKDISNSAQVVYKKLGSPYVITSRNPSIVGGSVMFLF